MIALRDDDTLDLTTLCLPDEPLPASQWGPITYAEWCGLEAMRRQRKGDQVVVRANRYGRLAIARSKP